MAYVDLDKIINVTTGGGGTIYPDVPYPVLNQRIGIFNKPDARDTDSNGWFGLLGNSVAGICQQNYNFNQQIALAIDSGVGALSTRVKSYDFSTDIDKIYGGKIKYGLMSKGTNFFNINETSKKIKDIQYSDVVLSPAITFMEYNSKRSHIVTSGGNKFLLNDGFVYPVNSDNKIIGQSTDSYDVINNMYYESCLLSIIAVVGNMVWIAKAGYVNHNTVDWASIEGALISIGSNGTVTVIDNNVLITEGHIGDNLSYYDHSHYQYNETIAYGYAYSGGFNGSESKYYSLDLTNTTLFSFTTLTSNTGGRYCSDLSYFDGTGLCVVKQSNNDIIRLTSSGPSSSLGTYFGTIYTYTLNSMTDLYFPINKLALGQYMTSGTNNIYTTTTGLNIKGNQVGGDSITDFYKTHISFVYEVTGTKSQDDSFVGCLTDLTTIGETDTLTLSINSTLVETIENVLYNNGYGKTFTLPQITLGTPAVDIQLDYANTLANDLKLGFGITGGTYATPTLPSNNGMSGNQTTARTAGSDASYIDLTLSTN